MYESSSTCSALLSWRASTASGPERFFYDKTTYTGTHKHGGPKLSSNVVTDSALVNRDTVILGDGQRRKVGPYTPMGGSTLPVLLGGVTADDLAGEERDERSRSLTPRRIRHSRGP